MTWRCSFSLITVVCGSEQSVYDEHSLCWGGKKRCKTARIQAIKYNENTHILFVACFGARAQNGQKVLFAFWWPHHSKRDRLCDSYEQPHIVETTEIIAACLLESTYKSNNSSKVSGVWSTKLNCNWNTVHATTNASTPPSRNQCCLFRSAVTKWEKTQMLGLWRRAHDKIQAAQQEMPPRPVSLGAVALFAAILHCIRVIIAIIQKYSSFSF